LSISFPNWVHSAPLSATVRATANILPKFRFSHPNREISFWEDYFVCCRAATQPAQSNNKQATVAAKRSSSPCPMTHSAAQPRTPASAATPGPSKQAIHCTRPPATSESGHHGDRREQSLDEKRTEYKYNKQPIRTKPRKALLYQYYRSSSSSSSTRIL